MRFSWKTGLVMLVSVNIAFLMAGTDTQQGDITSETEATDPTLLPAEPNTLANTPVPVPDRIELSCGAVIFAKITSVTFQGAATPYRRDTIRKITIVPNKPVEQTVRNRSQDRSDTTQGTGSVPCGIVELTLSDGSQEKGSLARLLVTSGAGTMTFAYDDLRAVALDAQPGSQSMPAMTGTQLTRLKNSRELSATTNKKLKAVQVMTLNSIDQIHAKALGDAEEDIDNRAREYDRLRQIAARSMSRSRQSSSTDAHFKVALDLALADLKEARAWKDVILKDKIQEKKATSRFLGEGVKCIQATAVKFGFVMRSGGTVSADKMQEAFSKESDRASKQLEGLVSAAKENAEEREEERRLQKERALGRHGGIRTIY